MESYQTLDFSRTASDGLAEFADGVTKGSVWFDDALMAHQLFVDIERDPDALSPDMWMPLSKDDLGVFYEARSNSRMLVVTVWEPRPDGQPYIHDFGWTPTT